MEVAQLVVATDRKSACRWFDPILPRLCSDGEIRKHDWLKTSCRNGLPVQIRLGVIYACVVQLEDTADLGSVALWYEGSRPFAGKYASVVQMVGSDGCKPAKCSGGAF